MTMVMERYNIVFGTVYILPGSFWKNVAVVVSWADLSLVDIVRFLQVACFPGLRQFYDNSSAQMIELQVWLCIPALSHLYFCHYK